MNNLQIIKSANFNGVQCDFYKNEQNDVFMTRNQIGVALEYTHPNDSIRKIHKRYKERLDKFSVSTNLVGTDGKSYETVVYNAKGIYEICRWSKQEKANIFYDWVYELLESLRKGEMRLVTMTEYQQNKIDIQLKNAETRLKYAKIKEADLLLKIADRTKIPEYHEVLNSKAAELITGTQLIPLPEVERKTYSATDIGNILGISANKVGTLANKHNLKVDEFGKFFFDKARHSVKEVETFRYYIEVVPVLRDILLSETA